MICDRVAILNHGQVIRQGTIEELLAPTTVTEIVVAGIDSNAVQQITALGAVCSQRDGNYVFELHDHSRALDVIDIIRDHKGQLISITQRQETLEDVFVKAVRETGAPEIT